MILRLMTKLDRIIQKIFPVTKILVLYFVCVYIEIDKDADILDIRNVYK